MHPEPSMLRPIHAPHTFPTPLSENRPIPRFCGQRSPAGLKMAAMIPFVPHGPQGHGTGHGSPTCGLPCAGPVPPSGGICASGTRLRPALGASLEEFGNQRSEFAADLTFNCLLIGET